MTQPTLAHLVLGLLAALATPTPVTADASYPIKLSTDDLSGLGFNHPDTIVTETSDGQILDRTSLKSSDGRFASGIYSAGPSRIEINEPYGVDEFMFFLEGGVTLTASDGNTIHVHAGEAVTIPKEFTGVWETDGYRKIWVIYSSDGTAL